MNTEMISIVIPCRNEERYIAGCLKSVLEFEVPAGYETEIFLVDGDSSDNTLQIVREIQKHSPNLHILRNERIYQSFAINVALNHARGEWIMRLDAHSFYPRDYLKLCIQTSIRTNADNVGGLFVTLPGGTGYQAQLVQAMTTHKFGVGDSGFRTDEGDGPADTVPYGFFRRDVFEKVGKMDERLVRAQDYEFNRRIIRAGGKVWRNPEIKVLYHNQPTLLAFYKKQLMKEAPYNAYLWYVAPHAFAWRHAITGLFSLGVVCGALLSPVSSWISTPFEIVMALYFVLSIVSSVQQAFRYKMPLHVVVLPFCFFFFHFIHGLGVISGVSLLALGKAPVQKKPDISFPKETGGTLSVKSESQG